MTTKLFQSHNTNLKKRHKTQHQRIISMKSFLLILIFVTNTICPSELNHRKHKLDTSEDNSNTKKQKIDDSQENKKKQELMTQVLNEFDQKLNYNWEQRKKVVTSAIENYNVHPDDIGNHRLSIYAEAAGHKDHVFLKYLLDKSTQLQGTALKALDEEKFSMCLFEACNVQCVQLILATKRAKVTYKKNGDTLFHTIVTHEYDPELIPLYARCGLDSYSVDSCGYTPLTFLVKQQALMADKKTEKYIKNFVDIGVPAETKIVTSDEHKSHTVVSLLEKLIRQPEKNDSSNYQSRYDSFNAYSTSNGYSISRELSSIQATLKYCLNNRRKTILEILSKTNTIGSDCNSLIVGYYEPTWEELEKVEPKE